MRKPGGRPTREQTVELDAKILDGARSTFCRGGVANASLDEIALLLGVSKHTIYRRYPDKAALLEAVVERDIGRFREALASAAGKPAKPIDALRRTAQRYFEIGSSRDYAAFYLSVSAEAALSAPLRRRLAAWSQSALEPLAAAISAAQAAGDLRPANPTTVRDILVDLLEGATNRVRLRQDGANGAGKRRQLFEQRWQVFLTAFGAGS